MSDESAIFLQMLQKTKKAADKKTKHNLIIWSAHQTETLLSGFSTNPLFKQKYVTFLDKGQQNR